MQKIIINLLIASALAAILSGCAALTSVGDALGPHGVRIARAIINEYAGEVRPEWETLRQAIDQALDEVEIYIPLAPSDQAWLYRREIESRLKLATTVDDYNQIWRPILDEIFEDVPYTPSLRPAAINVRTTLSQISTELGKEAGAQTDQ